MVIFGVALLSGCMLAGIFLGEVLGSILGVDSNIGGVGLAMLFLILIVDYLTIRDKISIPAQSGIQFWSAMYIPIVVAMAANQNVAGAIDGGPLALIAGLAATFAGWALVPWLSKIKKNPTLTEAVTEPGGESNVSNDR